MAEERFEEQTEPATYRRRQEAREHGHVARSMDLTAAVILLAAVLALNFFGSHLMNYIISITQSTLGNLAAFDVDQNTISSFIGHNLYLLAVALLPLLLVVMVVGIAINIAQVGWILTPEPLAFNLAKVNPFEGWKRLVSLQAWVRLLSGIFKVTVLAVVLFWTLWHERFNLINLMDRDFRDIVHYMVEMAFLLSMRAVMALLILAILDYAYQKWQYEKQLMMTKQEVKEELKRMEGDPKIRERRKVIQRQLAMQRMMQKVPKATVVITNPTEVAVAVRYERGDELDAPLVVAKGLGAIAQRIRDIATEHKIPIVQEPPLARALYKAVEVGKTIPPDLYEATAKILAYVYSLRGMKSVA